MLCRVPQFVESSTSVEHTATRVREGGLHYKLAASGFWRPLAAILRWVTVVVYPPVVAGGCSRVCGLLHLLLHGRLPQSAV